jgi:hypothetical protein
MANHTTGAQRTNKRRQKIYNRIDEAAKKQRQFTMKVNIISDDNGYLQLKQLLDEEVKTDYIKSYEVKCERFIVKSVYELKLLAADGANFFLTLNGGLRSSKYIQWETATEKFYVMNEIDGSEQNLSEKELFTESNIGEAINKNALIFEN